MKTIPTKETIQTDALKRIKGDAEQARTYLNEGFNTYHENKEIVHFLLVIRTLIEASGGLDLVAKKAGMNPESLIKALSGDDMPAFGDMAAILRGLGYYISLVKKT